MSVELISHDCTIVCAWCDVVLENGKPTEQYMEKNEHRTLQVSHSICVPCSEKLL